jgi:hypothetical protein
LSLTKCEFVLPSELSIVTSVKIRVGV